MGSLEIIVLVITASVAINGSLTKDKPYYNVTDTESILNLFENFIAEHNKQYHSEEERKNRYENFVENLKKINDHNKRSESSVQGINRFTDLTDKEFIMRHTGYKYCYDYEYHKVIGPDEIADVINLSDVPEAFDWTALNVVTEVKDQGDCGSCWAFSAIGVIESQYAIKYKELVQFSEQQLVSCSTGQGTNGCCDGCPEPAFESLISMGGVETEQTYPYISGMVPTSFKCKFDESNAKAVVEDHYVYDFNCYCEDEVKAILFKNGPLAISVSSRALRSYYNGIIVEDCNDNAGNLDHAVLLVGYGVENGIPFWKVKNSWGKHYGENGYFRMKRGVNCLSFMDAYGAMATIKKK